MNSPYIVEETQDFAVVFKPPKMHCRDAGSFAVSHGSEIANQKKVSAGQETLLEWYSKKSKNVFDIMHRLDFETHGLVLFARNEKSFRFLKQAQDKGEFIKEYSAICQLALHDTSRSSFSAPCSQLPISHSTPQGFPPPPVISNNISRENPFVIESYFRPFGPGRKQVRPVIEDGKKHKETAKDKGGFYRTEIINIKGNSVTARIKRGFRHQIRCHLCWIGFPILNDPLYSGESASAIEMTANELPADKLPAITLALRAHAIFFPDISGKQLEFRVSPLQ